MLLGVSLATLAGAGEPVTGAIFTTTDDGAVNHNIYDSKLDVYLNGGPARKGAAGLPDGEYYVQVTDPSGASVLGSSTDCSDATPIEVVDGEFVKLYKLWDIVCQSSGVQGYKDTPNNGGEYKVWVSSVSDFSNDQTKTDNFKVKSSDSNAILHVAKYYDANANGTLDSGESYVDGWRVHVEGEGGYTDVVYTSWTATVDPGTWNFTESLPIESNWRNTSPTTVSLTVYDGDEKTVLFGNLCLGSGGGHTLGYWSNKNGQALVDGSDLSSLSSLYLANATGASFDPSTGAALRSWLLKGEATNMSYMLSVQLAAMKLNVLNGYVSGSAIVYAPGCGDNSLADVDGDGIGDFITVDALMAKADGALLADPYTPSGDSNRAYQECLKNALDNANNDGTFVQATACSFTFE